MSYDYNRHKSYPKLSENYSIEKIKKLMVNFNCPENIEKYSIDNAMSNLRLSNHYCDNTEVSVDCFYFNWPYSDCNNYMKQLALLNYSHLVDDDIEFPVMATIERIAQDIHVQHDPYAEIDDNFYFDHDGLLKIVRTLRLSDPCDENDDGVEIMLYENMDSSKFDDIIHDFFYYAYIKHMGDLPEELRKPITKMTDDEYQVFMMYVI